MFTQLRWAALMLLLGGALPQRPLPQSPPRADDDAGLVGLWGSETVFGPLARGRLTLANRGAVWTARIAGYEVEPVVRGDSVRVTLPGGEGEFRGSFVSRRSVKGFWIQPPGVWLGNAYASPATLDSAGAGVWVGAIEPLDDRLSLYVAITRGDDGSLSGVFRNPEAGLTGGGRRFTVTRSGDAVRFVDVDRPQNVLTAGFDSIQGQLVLSWPAVGRPLVLTKRERDQALGLFPRLAEPAGYTYRPPLQRRDGWQTADARSVGIDPGALTALVRHIIGADPLEDSTNLVHGVVVARHGKLVLEEYFYGYDADRVHDLRSESKPLASLLLGVASDHDVGIGPDTPVMSLFKGPFADADPRKANVTLAELLTHSSGLACDDADAGSPGNENRMQQHRELDWYRYVLDLPLIHAPGTHWAYCSAGINLVGGAVRNATHRWLVDYFDQNLAAPLDISRYYLQLMPDTEAYLGGGLYLRPRDALKLGQLVLDGGRWRGRQVLSRRWIEESTAGGIAGRDGDREGYAWHVYALQAGGRRYREIEANGTGGQILLIIPELDMTVFITAGNFNSYLISRRSREELVSRLLIPGVIDP